VTAEGVDRQAATTRAFDRLASQYDALSSGELFRLQRARTHRMFARCFDTTSRVLEIGCGTGIDTEFLALRCRAVVACDPSEEMVTRTLRRLAQRGLNGHVTVMPCGLQDLQAYLDALVPQDPFDGIVSNFGALNCVEHLAPLGALVRRHLRRGGVMVLGLMTRVCALEAAYFALTGRSQLAARRLAPGAVAVPVAGLHVATYYHRINDVTRAVASGVRLSAVEGLGVAIPPPYLEPRWRELPRHLRRALAVFDGAIAPWPPFNRVGDHVLLQFVKEPVHG
jgi:ubiquinone/menaquinone biosynthesis C-methylase UbiE